MSSALAALLALGTVLAGAGAVIVMTAAYLGWLSRNALTGGGGVTRHTETFQQTQQRQEQAQSRALAKLRPMRPVGWLMLVVGLGVVVGAVAAFR